MEKTENNYVTSKEVVIASEKLDSITKLKTEYKLAFELNTILKLVKKEYREDVKKYYISSYFTNEDNQTKNTSFVSSLLLILELDIPAIEKMMKIQELCNLIKTDADLCKFKEAVVLVRNLGNNGNKINEFIPEDFFEVEYKEAQNELNEAVLQNIKK